MFYSHQQFWLPLVAKAFHFHFHHIQLPCKISFSCQRHFSFTSSSLLHTLFTKKSLCHPFTLTECLLHSSLKGPLRKVDCNLLKMFLLVPVDVPMHAVQLPMDMAGRAKNQLLHLLPSLTTHISNQHHLFLELSYNRRIYLWRVPWTPPFLHKLILEPSLPQICPFKSREQ